jgi:uncharacterized membrane protein
MPLQPNAFYLGEGKSLVLATVPQLTAASLAFGHQAVPRGQVTGTGGTRPMAATIPAHAVIASFRFEDGAGNALGKLKDLNKQQAIGIQNAAVLKVGNDGKLRINETADMSGGRGMMVGGVVGGVIGLFGSSVLWPLGIGAAVGGLAAKLRDSGFPNQKLQEVGAKLQPGNSLLIVAVEDAAVESVSGILKDAGADVIREAIDGKVVEELETAAAATEEPAAADAAGAASAS